MFDFGIESVGPCCRPPFPCRMVQLRGGQWVRHYGNTGGLFFFPREVAA